MCVAQIWRGYLHLTFLIATFLNLTPASTVGEVFLTPQLNAGFCNFTP
jgi:hypothetical protein